LPSLRLHPAMDLSARGSVGGDMIPCVRTQDRTEGRRIFAYQTSNAFVCYSKILLPSVRPEPDTGNHIASHAAAHA